MVYPTRTLQEESISEHMNDGVGVPQRIEQLKTWQPWGTGKTNLYIDMSIGELQKADAMIFEIQ
jgi:hypothetical protein